MDELRAPKTRTGHTSSRMEPRGLGSRPQPQPATLSPVDTAAASQSTAVACLLHHWLTFCMSPSVARLDLDETYRARELAMLLQRAEWEQEEHSA